MRTLGLDDVISQSEQNGKNEPNSAHFLLKLELKHATFPRFYLKLCIDDTNEERFF